VTRSLPALDENDAAERIRRAGIALFRARGYHGASVRALADAVGVEAPTLYYHFPSKQEILCDIFDRTMNDFLAGLEKALGSATSFETRLRAVVRFHVIFHIERRDEAFISHSELRSLSAPNRRRINAKRDHYEAMIRAFLTEGVNAGAFEITDVRLMTIAILMMCSGVSDWFVEKGRLRGDAIANTYGDIVLRLVARSGDSRAGQRSSGHGGDPLSKPRRRRRDSRAR
jgi:AcrR family transcriptional regulator